MNDKGMKIGIVTDEISRDLALSLGYAREWGIRLFELREGGEHRFPYFGTDEVSLVDESVATGEIITAVSPGIFKQSATDERTTNRELEEVLPRSIELAARFGCQLVIVFGFERLAGDGMPVAGRERVLAMRAFEAAAEQATAAGMTIAIENEPDFCIDGPVESVDILNEIGHPALKLNWDPANRIWGGRDVTREDFTVLEPYIANLHVKDFDPADEKAPWVPVGSGVIAWEEILDWVKESGRLQHATLETHCVDGVESSRRSLERLRELLRT